MSLAVRLYLLAFLSGAAALAYEVSWTKWLSLSFGSSTLGASTAVAGFMGGMGIGAWAYHRVQGRVASPLRLYALLEFGIALTAVGLTFLLERLPPIFAALLSALPEAGGAVVVVRIIGALSILIVPTALMGATYPALCSVVIESRDTVDRHLGSLYGWNTIGAAIGGLTAGIALIPTLGLNGSIAVGVVLNVGVGIAAWVLASSRSVADAAAGPADVGSAGAEDEPLASRLPHRVTGVILFTSGFATLAYEIVWFRAYRPVAGNSTFAFTIVLVTFLLGLGFGALGLRRVVARGQPERALALVQFGIAITAALCMLILHQVLATPTGQGLLIMAPGVRAMEWPVRLAMHGGLALAMMLPATLLMGLSFPLASRMYLGDVTRVGQRVGGAVLFANLGSILGSIGAATVLLPWLGTMGSTRLLVCVNVVLALAAAYHAVGSSAQRLRWVAPSLAAVVVLAVLIPPSLPDHRNPLGTLESRIVFEEEGELATVRVAEGVENPAFRGMSIDGTTIGVSEGWSFPIYSKQLMLAHLPMWLEPRTKSVLQIGLGSASTLDTLTRYPGLERIESVEINAAVVRGAEFFEQARAFEDPRVTVHVEDAIHFLLSSDRRWDLIIADGKQNADFSGNAKMLSRELYELALSRLTERGMFVQWVATTTLPDDFATVGRTAASVFPHLNVFYEIPVSTIFVGSSEPLHGRRRMPAEDVPAAALSSLEEILFPRLDLLRYGWMTDRDGLMETIGPGPINTWSNSVLEFAPYRASAADWSYSQDAANIGMLLGAREIAYLRAPEGFVATDPALREAHLLVWVAQVYWHLGQGDELETTLDRLEQLAPEDPIVGRALLRLRPATG